MSKRKYRKKLMLVADEDIEDVVEICRIIKAICETQENEGKE